MNDDQMDDLLIQGAKDYNEPGQIPREEMWARLSEARKAARTAPAADVRQPRRLRTWAAIGVAAAAVLVLGIAIGRRLERPAASQSPTVATTPVAPPVAHEPPPTAPSTAVAQAKNISDDSLIKALRTQTRNTQRRAEALAANGSTQDSGPNSNLAYRLVVLQHLAGSEAMITAFRSSAKHGEVDAQIANWSRELLSTTRMLEASSATQDPTMKRLLEDLDLVIVQISRYVTRGTNNPEDLDLIEQSINKRGVINRLRSTLPARNAPVGT
jgi:hypothetical protein